MKTTAKKVQVFYSCVCGYNEVNQEKYSIRWKDLSKCGIKRRKCKSSGEPFLFKQIEISNCTGEHYI